MPRKTPRPYRKQPRQRSNRAYTARMGNPYRQLNNTIAGATGAIVGVGVFTAVANTMQGMGK